MKRLKAVFFCGHRSPYGLAHLKPILEHFEVPLVVVASQERWTRFSRALSGFEHHSIVRGTAIGRLRAEFEHHIRQRLSRDPEKERIAHIKRVLGAKGVRIEHIFDVNSKAFLDKLRDIEIDVGLSAAYPQIFADGLLRIPSRGSINFHPSLLPNFRGAHPHFWAIALGAAESGVSAHFMTERLDDGPILACRKIRIADLTYSEFYREIVAETPHLVEAVAAFLSDPLRQAQPQDESKATIFRNDRQIHRRVFWSIQKGEEIRNLVRTETAFCFFRNKHIELREGVVFRTNRNLTNDVRVEPGTIIDLLENHIIVKATDQCIGFARIHGDYGQLLAPAWAKKVDLVIGEKFV